jgi:quercetin dioxygenase-like cupin family protein
MTTEFTVPPLTEEQKPYYIRNPQTMNNDERTAYIEKKRASIVGWTKPLNVEEVKAGSDPTYNDLNQPHDDVLSSISLVANMWVKQMIFEQVGDLHPGHCHTFDHQTLLARGKLELTANGKITEYTAPTIIYIKAGIKHGMMALEDTTVVYCMHPLRGSDQVGDIIDPASIPDGVMPLLQRQGTDLIPITKI